VEFIYGKSMTRGGYTWYCQSAGTSWKTDPSIGWHLFYTDGPSWWLICPDYSERCMNTTKLGEAMLTAANYISGKKGWE
jgi:hypothetical protein